MAHAVERHRIAVEDGQRRGLRIGHDACDDSAVRPLSAMFSLDYSGRPCQF
jgi:hypothetical protein